MTTTPQLLRMAANCIIPADTTPRFADLIDQLKRRADELTFAVPTPIGERRDPWIRVARDDKSIFQSPETALPPDFLARMQGHDYVAPTLGSPRGLQTGTIRERLNVLEKCTKYGGPIDNFLSDHGKRITAIEAALTRRDTELAAIADKVRDHQTSLTNIVSNAEGAFGDVHSLTVRVVALEEADCAS